MMGSLVGHVSYNSPQSSRLNSFASEAQCEGNMAAALAADTQRHVSSINAVFQDDGPSISNIG